MSKRIQEFFKSNQTNAIIEISEKYDQASTDREFSADHIDTLIIIAEAFRLSGKDTKATEYAEKLKKSAEKSSDFRLKAMSDHKLGVFYKRLNNLPLSGSFLESALSNAEKTGDCSLKAVVLNDLGNWNIAKGNIRAAAENFQNGSDNARSVGNCLLEVNALTNSARAFYDLGMFEQASASAEKSSGVILKGKTPDMIYPSLALMNLLLDCADKSIGNDLSFKLRQKAEKHYKQINSVLPEIRDKLELSYVYGGLGFFLEKKIWNGQTFIRKRQYSMPRHQIRMMPL